MPRTSAYVSPFEGLINFAPETGGSSASRKVPFEIVNEIEEDLRLIEFGISTLLMLQDAIDNGAHHHGDDKIGQSLHYVLWPMREAIVRLNKVFDLGERTTKAERIAMRAATAARCREGDANA